MQIFSSSLRNQQGAVDDHIALLLGLVPIMFLVLPACGEILLGYLQGQELEALSKAAAERACAIMVSHTGGDVTSADEGLNNQQGALSPLVPQEALFDRMEALMNQVVAEQAKNPATYPVPNRSLVIEDVFGADLMDDRFYNIGGINYIGVSKSTAVCPSNPGQPDDWCLNQGEDAIADVFRLHRSAAAPAPADQSNISDLSYRMMALQGYRCQAGDPDCDNHIRQNLRGKLAKCRVCLTKQRESIFSPSASIFSTLRLSCDHATANYNGVLLPCLLSKCAEATFKGTTASFKRSRALGVRNAPPTGSMAAVLPNYRDFEMTRSTNQIIGFDPTDPRYQIRQIQDLDADGKALVDHHLSVDANFFADDYYLDGVGGGGP